MLVENVFKKKLNADGKVKKQRSWLVEKGYSQLEGIEFGELFSLFSNFFFL